jgi:hypothetical protein
MNIADMVETRRRMNALLANIHAVDFSKHDKLTEDEPSKSTSTTLKASAAYDVDHDWCENRFKPLFMAPTHRYVLSGEDVEKVRENLAKELVASPVEEGGSVAEQRVASVRELFFASKLLNGSEYVIPSQDVDAVHSERLREMQREEGKLAPTSTNRLYTKHQHSPISPPLSPHPRRHFDPNPLHIDPHARLPHN